MKYEKKQVLEVIVDVFGVKVEEIKDDSKFIEDLGADSLDTSELIINLEDKLDIKFDDNVDKIKTVKELFDYLDKI